MNRGILATCYARPAGAAPHTDGAARRAARRLRRRAVRASSPTVAVDQGHARLERRPHDGPVRRRGRTGSWPSAPSTTSCKGAAGQTVQCANLLARPARDHRPHHGRGCIRERHCRRRASSPAGRACGHQGRRRPRPRPRRDRRRRSRSPPPPSSRPTRRPPRRCMVSRRPPRRHQRHAAAVVLNSGNANAATGAAGRRPTPSACARSWPTSSAATPTRCWCARPASSASRCRSTPIEAGVPAAGGRPRPPDGGARRGRGDHDHRHRTARRRSRSTAASPSAAWPRARRCSRPNMATMLAVLTTDAAIDPPTLPAAPARRRGRSFNRLIVDGCTSHQRHGASLLASGKAGPRRAERRPRRVHRRAHRGLRRPGRADGGRRRGRHQGGAGRASRARPATHDARTRRPGRRREPARSARGTARTRTGAGS